MRNGRTIDSEPADTPGPARERAFRRELGIPDDAARVLVLAESTHWDPDWLVTSDEYFRFRIRRTLGRAVEDCLADPRRVFDVECVFFLRMYWERVPRHREAIVTLLNERRWRMTGSGITTPDTLLPTAEAITRDFLLGQEWLRSIGVTQEPALAYFPDDFGHSPALPSLLRSMGFDRTVITRIDGMYFVGCDWELPGAFPRAGSSAELLERERTLDFVWRAPDGAEVLCHWNAFGYGQGELLAHSGITRAMGLPLAVPNRSDRHVARRIDRYVTQLAGRSRTPYLLCPIGFDFSMPIPGLVRLCDRYNERHSPETGTWVVNAGLDDYLALVDEHRPELPTLALDPNPYWTGFYASRPTLKQRAHDLVQSLLRAEMLAETRDAATRLSTRAALAPAWDIAVTANHHDFITGTSPDRVHRNEQVPWLETARREVDGVLRSFEPDATRIREGAGDVAPSWRRDGDRTIVETATFTLAVDASRGGAIVDLHDEKHTYLRAPANDVVAMRDAGGLWRMGHEFKGGRFTAVDRASDHPATVDVREADGELEIEIRGEVDGVPVRRTLRMANETPMLRARCEVAANEGRSVLVQLETAIHADALVMDVPGGVVARPLHKGYDPTFWSASSFVHAVDSSGHGLGVLVPRTASVSVAPTGRIDLVAARNAPIEKAWGWLPIPGHPARGTEPGIVTFEYALVPTESGSWLERRLPHLAHQLWGVPYAGALVLDRDDVWIGAAKAAHRGAGSIVRLVAPGASKATPIDVRLRSEHRQIRAARRCDGRERDVEELAVDDGAVVVGLDTPVTTVRIVADDETPGDAR